MNKKARSPLTATILIVGFTIILSAVVMSWGIPLIKNNKRYCQDNPSECVCEEYGNHYSWYMGKEDITYLPNECIKIETSPFDQRDICIYREDENSSSGFPCKSWIYKTEEEKYCDSNPNDKEKCECQEWNEYYKLKPFLENMSIETMNVYKNSLTYNLTNRTLESWYAGSDGGKESVIFNCVWIEYIKERECIKIVPREN